MGNSIPASKIKRLIKAYENYEVEIDGEFYHINEQTLIEIISKSTATVKLNKKKTRTWVESTDN